MANARTCIKEERIESLSGVHIEGWELWLIRWDFYYSDGTVESVTKSERRG